MNGVAIAVGSAVVVVGAIAISAAVRSGGSAAENEAVALDQRMTAPEAVNGGAERSEDRPQPLTRGPSMAELAQQAASESDNDANEPQERAGRRGDRRGRGGDNAWNREIDPDDLDAQLEAQLRRAERMQRWMLDRFDTDGDGVLNEEELARMQEFQERRMNQMRDRLEQAWGGEIPLTNEEMMAYAGVIGRQMGEARREMMQDFLRDQGVSSFRDLSPEQRRQMGPVMRDAMQNMQQDFINQYDSSGDGRLSAADRERAANDIRDQISTMQNLRLIDLNRDGNISPAEIQHYLDRFNRGDPTADLNGDGVVDVRDLQIFNEVISAN
ncbi:MAG: hypothetical protein EA423_05490 [Phycisphaerales bacterium]|nr:MAG: hypothetical protein EA423_05490 [Phycisphaerales bacterium]